MSRSPSHQHTTTTTNYNNHKPQTTNPCAATTHRPVVEIGAYKAIISVRSFHILQWGRGGLIAVLIKVNTEGNAPRPRARRSWWISNSAELESRIRETKKKKKEKKRKRSTRVVWIFFNELNIKSRGSYYLIFLSRPSVGHCGRQCTCRCSARAPSHERLRPAIVAEVEAAHAFHVVATIRPIDECPAVTELQLAILNTILDHLPVCLSAASASSFAWRSRSRRCRRSSSASRATRRTLFCGCNSSPNSC